jgi:hypothetical protein
LQSDPSEWKTGESDPKDFTAEAVVEVLKNADDDERKRVQSADERETVKNFDPNAEEDSDDGTVKEVDYDDLPDYKDEAYDPLQDPSVPSSVIAENVATELKVLDGKSPTLNACREAYKANHADDNE